MGLTLTFLDRRVGSPMRKAAGRRGWSREACGTKARKLRPGMLVCVWAWPPRTARTKAELAGARKASESAIVHLLLCILTFAGGPHPRHQSTEGWAGKGCVRRPNNPKLKRHLSLILGPVEDCPSSARDCAPPSAALKAGRGANQKGGPCDRGAGERGNGAAIRVAAIW